MRHIRQSASSLGCCVCVFMYVYYVLINGWHLPPRKGVKEHRSHKHYKGITYLNIIYFGGCKCTKTQPPAIIHSSVCARFQQNNGGKQHGVLWLHFEFDICVVDCMIISFREICYTTPKRQCQRRSRSRIQKLVNKRCQ